MFPSTTEKPKLKSETDVIADRYDTANSAFAVVVYRENGVPIAIDVYKNSPDSKSNGTGDGEKPLMYSLETEQLIKDPKKKSEIRESCLDQTLSFRDPNSSSEDRKDFREKWKQPSQFNQKILDELKKSRKKGTQKK